MDEILTDIVDNLTLVELQELRDYVNLSIEFEKEMISQKEGK